MKTVITIIKVDLAVAYLYTLKRGILECSKQIYNQSIYRVLLTFGIVIEISELTF